MSRHWTEYGNHKPKAMNKANFNYLSRHGKPLILTIEDFKITEHQPYGADYLEDRITLLFFEPDACPFVMTNERCSLMSELVGSGDPADWVGKTIELRLKSKGDKKYPELERKLYKPKLNHLSKENAVKALEMYQRDRDHYWLNRHFLFDKGKMRDVMKRIEDKAHQIFVEKEFAPKPPEKKAKVTKVQIEAPASQSTDKTTVNQEASNKTLVKGAEDGKMKVLEGKIKSYGQEKEYTADELRAMIYAHFEFDKEGMLKIEDWVAMYGFAANPRRQ